ncbi:MAG: nucleotide exchange factor GrpE [Defluviitaleaceae bacterium]|nr:nucleotide exchange factor GrpE [Defluviitaleaceae bacterium]MCL2262771.1 nucleotide exchange factor GrpE [Defluviitaleaceae bacterium]
MPKKKKDENPTPETPQEPIPSEVVDTAPDGKYAEMLDKYQRCLAEFDNFRKRTTKELADRRNDGIRAACEKLLPIIDNFDRALSTAENKEDNFYKGIEMVARQFDTMLDELGVKSIPTEPNSPFDTNLHYAVAHITDESLGENTIAETLQKGYIHQERVIRPAMVKVAN